MSLHNSENQRLESSFVSLVPPSPVLNANEQFALKRRYSGMSKLCRMRQSARYGACTDARLSEKEHKGNALASGAEEGRDKLRKASGSGTYASIRRYPNGETRQSSTLSSVTESIGCGGEPPELKHLSRARKRHQPRFRK